MIPVILSGGAGTRLWPVSREEHPKPFMRMADGQSLLQKTYSRAATLDGTERVVIVTNRDYYFKSKDEIEHLKSQTGTVSSSFLLEPVGRNTAPAIAMAALSLAAEQGDDALLLVLPADHLINDQAGFAEAVTKATTLALQDKLVTFGIVPTAPETGFGYIECGPACGTEGYLVASFVEKPAFEVAQQYVASSKYLWNSGMFCFKAGVFLRELETYAPAIYQGAADCWQITRAGSDAARMIELDQESFSQLPELSIDYAVMEKSDKVVVVAGRFDWSDIGSWDAVGDLIRPDEAGNSVIGEAVLVDVRNTLIQAGARMVAAVGVENLVIVDTADALLVADRSRTQDVRKVVQQLKLLQHESYKTHRQVMRPWGSYTLLEEGSGFKIKRIEVKQGGALSLQMHYHRSEHWIVVSGTAKVTNGEKSYLVNTNESTFIPAGHRHRLENPGQLDLIMIEVQSGAYLGEDDIVRFEDNYGRS